MQKNDLINQVIMGGRQYGINMVLFRHLVGETLGVNVTDMECLGILFFKGTSTPSELAEHTGLSSGATTAMLDRLERAKLIIRRPNPNDRRGTLITTAKDTAAKIAPLFASIRQAQNKLISHYSEKELSLIADYFTKSVALWEKERVKLKENLQQNNL